MPALLAFWLLLAGPLLRTTDQSRPTHASLRGLCVVSVRVVWASGTAGTYLRTTDGGAHWSAGQVPGAARLDFRDVKAFSAQLAYLIAVGARGGIYKTSDGGAHWTTQYQNSDPGFFLDGIAFWDPNHGLALGDPLHGGFLLLRTSDGGRHWQADAHLPPALPGEGAFAASGTSLVVGAHHQAWFATGGISGARVFHSGDAGRTWTAAPTPLGGVGPQYVGAGIFSLAFANPQFGVAVGGDYTHPGANDRTVAITHDGGQHWTLSARAFGYRSAVAVVPGTHGREWFAVGPAGADVSHDGGATWTAILSGFANSIAFAPDGSIGWSVGARGRIESWRP